MKVLFFASVRERLGSGECEFTGAALPPDLDALREALAARSEVYREVLAQPNLLCAVNQAVVHDNVALEPDDEVAFFPPVTGG